jgi:hypothetical protein
MEVPATEFAHGMLENECGPSKGHAANVKRRLKLRETRAGDLQP